MNLKILKTSIKFLLFGMFFSGLVGCFERGLDLGNWHMQKEDHQYICLNTEQYEMFSSADLSRKKAFIHLNNIFRQIKEVGESPLLFDAVFEPYSVIVRESGYSFLQLAKNVGDRNLFDEIEWGWKIVIENKSKQDIYAVGEYALLDKEGLTLTSTLEDMENRNNLLIKAGGKGILQGKKRWYIYKKSKPYPAKRVVRGDYTLSLRYPDRLDTLLSH